MRDLLGCVERFVVFASRGFVRVRIARACHAGGCVCVACASLFLVGGRDLATVRGCTDVGRGRKWWLAGLGR